MSHLQLSDRVVQNRPTGEQMTHWDMFNKENSIQHVIARLEKANLEIKGKCPRKVTASGKINERQSKRIL